MYNVPVVANYWDESKLRERIFDTERFTIFDLNEGVEIGRRPCQNAFSHPAGWGLKSLVFNFEVGRLLILVFKFSGRTQLEIHNKQYHL